MKNSNDFTMHCSNPEVVKAFNEEVRGDVKICKKCGTKISEHSLPADGGTKFSIMTKDVDPINLINGISKRFPDDVINCDYTLEHERHSNYYEVCYHNGEEIKKNAFPFYLCSDIEQKIESSVDIRGISDKAIDFFSRLDTVSIDSKGNQVIDWFLDGVCYKYYYDGETGKKYKIEATKDKNWIAFKVFKGIAKYAFKEQKASISRKPDTPVNDVDFPF